MSETRVVLVKPGDVLILGNVGSMDEAAFQAMHGALGVLRDALKLGQVVVFEQDIDLAAVPGGDGT